MHEMVVKKNNNKMVHKMVAKKENEMVHETIVEKNDKIVHELVSVDVLSQNIEEL